MARWSGGVREYSSSDIEVEMCYTWSCMHEVSKKFIGHFFGFFFGPEPRSPASLHAPPFFPFFTRVRDRPEFRDFVWKIMKLLCTNKHAAAHPFQGKVGRDRGLFFSFDAV